jgi:DNA-binding NarL/FixJ family response regulator
LPPAETIGKVIALAGAGLAAEGLRNHEIAARLFLSGKTVEANLSRVYRKLGIRSRAELTRHLGP